MKRLSPEKRAHLMHVTYFATPGTGVFEACPCTPCSRWVAGIMRMLDADAATCCGECGAQPRANGECSRCGAKVAPRG